MAIKVQVKEGHMVFYAPKRYREGDVFQIEKESEYSEKAMIRLGETKKPGPKPKSQE